MMKRLSTCLFSIAAIIVLCSGCVVTCTHPPFGLNLIEEDPTLIGRWLIPQAEGGGSIEFQRSIGTKFQVYVIKGQNERRGPIFAGYGAKAGDRKYMWLTLIEDGKEEAEAGHILVRYETSEAELTYWLLDREKVKAAVNEGRLKGRGIGGEGEVRLNSTADELAEAISGEALWKKESTLKKEKLIVGQQE